MVGFHGKIFFVFLIDWQNVSDVSEGVSFGGASLAVGFIGNCQFGSSTPTLE